MKKKIIKEELLKDEFIKNKVIKNNFIIIFIEKTGISEDEINEFNKKLKNGEIDIDNKL